MRPEESIYAVYADAAKMLTPIRPPSDPHQTPGGLEAAESLKETPVLSWVGGGGGHLTVFGSISPQINANLYWEIALIVEITSRTALLWSTGHEGVINSNEYENMQILYAMQGFSISVFIYIFVVPSLHLSSVSSLYFEFRSL